MCVRWKTFEKLNMPKKTQKTEESRTPRQSQRLRFQSSKRKFRCRSLYLHPPSCCAHLLSFAHIFCTYFAVLIPNWCTIFFAMLFAAFEDSFMVGNFVGAFLTVCFWFEFTTTGKWTSGGVRCVCKLVGILLNLFAALRFTFCEGRMERLKWSTHKCKSANSNTPLPHLSQRDN